MDETSRNAEFLKLSTILYINGIGFQKNKTEWKKYVPEYKYNDFQFHSV